MPAFPDEETAQVREGKRRFPPGEIWFPVLNIAWYCLMAL